MHADALVALQVGLYEEGACDEDTEWRHDCYLASKTLQAATSDGVVQFTYPEYRSAHTHLPVSSY